MHTQSISEGCARRIPPVWRDASFYPGLCSCCGRENNRTSCSSPRPEIREGKIWSGKNDQSRPRSLHSEISPELFKQTDLSVWRRWSCINVHWRDRSPVFIYSPNFFCGTSFQFAAPAGGRDVFHHGFSIHSYGA